MSDERARGAERARRTTGAAEDEARALVARLRAGSVRHDDLALDAYLGHAPAQLALGEAVDPVTFSGEDEAVLWLRGFAAFGHDVLLAALLGWLRAGACDERAWPPEVGEVFSAAEGRCAGPADERTWRFTRGRLIGGAAQGPAGRSARCALVASSVVEDPARALEHVDAAARAAADVAPDRVREALHLRGVVPRLAELPAGPRLRARVLEATTPADRRALVAALRAHEGRAVLLGLAGGERLEAELLEVGHEALGAITPGRAFRRVPLRDVLEVRAAE